VSVTVADLCHVVGLGLLCLAILGAGEWLHRMKRVDAEGTRKLAHVLIGFVACSFTWVFSRPEPVLLLCGGFVGLMAWTQIGGGLPSLHAVRRRSVGTVLYPAAVALVFLACGDQSSIYVPCLLVLAVADPAAALVGLRFGRHAFTVRGQVKSVEGSLAFFATAAACLFVSLALLPPPEAHAPLAIAIVVAALGTAAEAASPAGADNLTVPAAICAALLALTHAGPDEAFAQVAAWVMK
jgi:hypothetical protein